MATLTALVVDDYPQMRTHLVQRLEEIDIATIEASNGVEALEALEGGGTDIVFTDIVMPEMDGLELCEEIRRRADLRELPVIVSSTHRDATYVIRALRCGADDYVSKPASAAAIRKVIRRVMSHV